MPGPMSAPAHPGERDEAISRRIDDWLATHTFRHDAFSDTAALAALKAEQNLTISLCIPTLNEEDTVGTVVSVLREALIDQVSLLDEIVVVDSGSSDRTREIAATAGAEVMPSADILPSQGYRRGKGENLWKAVHHLRGDLICYVDGDIANIHPRFVTGLVGPLLHDQSLLYAKAFYERPIAHTGGLHPSGGGRVTEILIRPLFSLFFPELTALVQPLAGEYAARREVLERLAFPIGYGVETAHLIDVFRTWGLDALCQTDIDRRIHRNQSTHDLGRMAFGILQAFLRRLDGDVPPAASHLLRQFTTEGDYCRQTIGEIIEEERPPLIQLAEYLDRRRLFS